MADIFDLFKKISQTPTGALPVTHLLVGLGNPGEQYTYTRHNAGFLALTDLSNRFGAVVNRARFQALTGEATAQGKRLLLLRPQTFMNLSGLAVAEAAGFYKIKPENVLVLSDDIHLEVGHLRMRRGGSAGGHNGLKSIIEQLGTEAFPRFRIGVGQKPHPDMDLADWVLSPFGAEDRRKLAGAVNALEAGICAYLRGDTDGAMRICNSYTPDPAKEK